MTFEDFLLCCLTFYRTTNQWIKTKIKLINWQWNWLSVAAMENIFFMHVDYFLVFSPTENTFNHPFLWWNKIMAFFKNTTKVLSLFKNHFFFFFDYQKDQNIRDASLVSAGWVCVSVCLSSCGRLSASVSSRPTFFPLILSQIFFSEHREGTQLAPANCIQHTSCW